MTVGPGKYDAEAAAAMKATNAAGVILIVIGGDKGPGFSVQATHQVMLSLPTMLKDVAGQLEADILRLNQEWFDDHR